MSKASRHGNVDGLSDEDREAFKFLIAKQANERGLKEDKKKIKNFKDDDEKKIIVPRKPLKRKAVVTEKSDKPLILRDVISRQSDLYEKVESAEEFYVWKKDTFEAMKACCYHVAAGAKSYILYREAFKNNLTGWGRIWRRMNIKAFEETFGGKYGYYVWRKDEDGKDMQVTSGIGAYKKITSMWLYDPSVKIYAGEDFSTSPSSPDYVNTWNGLAVSRESAELKGDVSKAEKLVQFIKSSWCSNDEATFKHVMSWLAFTIQYPGIKLTTSLVLKGKEGVGKGLVVQKMFEIIGEDLCTQPSAEQSFGNFNATIGSKKFIFADEMFWGGNKAIRGTLFKNITEPYQVINEKYGPIVTMKNLGNWVFSSNEEQIIPAGPEARRFTVLNVEDTLIDEKQEIKTELAKTCPFSFALYLYNLPLGEWNPRSIINNDALTEQKIEGMDQTHTWLKDMIEEDEVFPWSDVLPKAQMLAECIKSLNGYKISKAQVAKRLFKIYRFIETRPKIEGKQVICYIIPSKNELIDAFNKYYRSEIIKKDIEEQEKKTD